MTWLGCVGGEPVAELGIYFWRGGPCIKIFIVYMKSKILVMYYTSYINMYYKQQLNTC